jgi:hypothetical protein
LINTMLKFIVLAIFIALVAVNGDGSSNIDALQDIARRMNINITEAEKEAEAQALTSLSTSFSSDIAGLLASVKQATQSLVTQLESDLTTAKNDLAQAVQQLTGDIQNLFGKSNALKNLVALVADAKSAIQLDCADLQQAAVEAVSAAKQAAADKLQAQLAEQQNMLQAAIDLPLYQAAQATGIAVATAKANCDTIINNIASARAVSAVRDIITQKLQDFVTSNNQALAQCQTSVQQRIAGLVMGVTSSWDDVKQTIITNATVFHDRVQTSLSNLIGDQLLGEIIVNDGVADEIAKAVKIVISFSVNQDNSTISDLVQKYIRIVQAFGISVSGDASASSAVPPPPSKRDVAQNGIALTIELDVKADVQINMPSINLTVVSNIVTATEQYAALVAQHASAAETKLQSILSTLSESEITAAKAAISAAVSNATQYLDAAKQTWSSALATLQSDSALVSQEVSTAVTDDKATVTKLWQLRGEQLAAKEAEVLSSVEDYKTTIQNNLLDQETIKQSILDAQASFAQAVAAGQADVQGQVNATIYALQDALRQKIIDCGITQDQLATLENNITAIIKSIEDQKADAVARIASIVKNDLTNTTDEIKAHLTEGADVIKARVQELANSINNYISSVDTSFDTSAPQLKASISVSSDSSVSSATVMQVLTVCLQAEFQTNQVNVVPTSSKRTTSTSTYSATVGAGTNSPAPASGLSLPIIIGIAVGAGVLVIIVIIVIVYVLKQRKLDNEYHLRA